MTTDKIPPQDIAAEQSVLGSILQNSQALNIALDLLQPEYFYLPKHKKIFDAAKHLDTLGCGVDLVTIQTVLRSNGRLEEIGGFSYLHDLIESSVNFDNIEDHCKLVIEAAIKYKILNDSNQIISEAYNPDSSAIDIITRQEQLFLDAHSMRPQAAASYIGEFLPGVIQNLIDINSGKIQPGIMTGFSDIDKLSGGMKPSEYIVLASRPGVGKTAFSLNVADIVACKHGKNVLIESLEMPKEQLGERLLAGKSFISTHDIKSGKPISDLRERLEEARQLLQNIYIDDPAGIDISPLKARIKRLVSRHAIDLLIIDYLGLISGPLPKDPTANTTYISNQIMYMLKEIKIPGLILSQLSRHEGKKEPIPDLKDLRQSGAIEQDAYQVWFLHREKNGDNLRNPETLWLLAKNRNGPTGKCDLKFDCELTKFGLVDNKRTEPMDYAKDTMNDMPWGQNG